jgi:hypothetical protein
MPQNYKLETSSILFIHHAFPSQSRSISPRHPIHLSAYHRNNKHHLPTIHYEIP